MISRRHRFHGYGSLKYVYRHGHIVRGPLFSIKHTQNPRRKSYRFAVVVSKKINKSAITRNRIRRRLYEAMRLMETDIKGPHDIVLTVFHDSIADESFEKLDKQLRMQLRRAGILDKISIRNS